MLNRWSALCLMLALAIGYAIAGTSVTAQSSSGGVVPLFVELGDELNYLLLVEKTSHGPCTVAEIVGAWMRCAPADKFARQADQDWFNLNHVIRINKRDRK
jgi:hypothetical protein